MPNSARIAIAAVVLTVTALGAASIVPTFSAPRTHAVVRADGGNDTVPSSTWQPGDMTWG